MTAEISIDFATRQPRMTLRDVRPDMKSTSLLYVLVGALLLFLIPLASASRSTPKMGPTDEATIAQVISETSKESLAEDSLDVYLSRLAFTFECTGACAHAEATDAPYRRIDSNGLYSHGCLQFQEATYFEQARKYGIDPNAGSGIYDCDNQLKIAKAMFQDDPVKAANHWYTSIYTRGLGLPE